MTTTVLNFLKAFALIALGLAIGAMGVYVAEVDDAPGGAAMGLVLMAAGVVLGVKAARNRLSIWAGRTAIGVGVLAAAFAAFLTQQVTAMVPLFAQAPAVPSAVASASSQYGAAIERAREAVRAAILEQNLPGVSVAVGIGLPAEASAKAGGSVVWAEGFGWRDVGTRTPVTADTRFNIGTAASVVAPAVASLGLSNTGAEATKEWSPEAIGEEGEDFPPLTMLRHLVWQPLGLMAPEYPLPGDRATFYVPRSGNDPGRGRQLMYMRDLACCVDGKTFYSTPSDLVRFALAKNPANVNGDLAGGMVMSLTTWPGNGVVVAVTSNIAHAKTAALAQRVAEEFIR